MRRHNRACAEDIPALTAMDWGMWSSFGFGEECTLWGNGCGLLRSAPKAINRRLFVHGRDSRAIEQTLSGRKGLGLAISGPDHSRVGEKDHITLLQAK